MSLLCYPDVSVAAERFNGPSDCSDVCNSCLKWPPTRQRSSLLNTPFGNSTSTISEKRARCPRRFVVICSTYMTTGRWPDWWKRTLSSCPSSWPCDRQTLADFFVSCCWVWPRVCLCATYLRRIERIRLVFATGRLPLISLLY